MTKQELWNHFIKSNPKWQTEGANLTANGLRKLIDTVYTEGAKQQRKIELGEVKEDNYQHDKSPEFNHLFDTIFGGKK